MSRLDESLVEVLQPLRDIAVGELLHALSETLEDGTEVRAEPILRDPEQRVLREGPLHLPRRADLQVCVCGRKTVSKVNVARSLAFEPVSVVRADGFTAIVAPFRWEAARLFVQGSQFTLNWTPIRRWFLEAFQTRYSDVSPDLDGAIHSIVGPVDVEGGWEFEVDFGSAPVETVDEMLDAFALSGAARVVIGSLNQIRNEAH